MTSAPTERDPVVAQALAAIPVPDHGVGFWERLENALAAEVPAPEAIESAPVLPPPATTVFLDNAREAPNVIAPEAPNVIEPEIVPAAVADIPLEAADPLEPRRRQWGRGAARILVAAAALAVFVGAGVVLARDDGDVGPDLSEQTTGTTGPGGATTTTAALIPSRQEQTVLDFVDALGSGAIGTAAASLGPRSKEYVVTQSGSVDAFLGEAAEGYGAWATSSDRAVSIIDAGGTWIVVLEGTVSIEGTSEYRRLAVPVVGSAHIPGAYFVDPWALDPGVEDQRFDFVSPEAGANGLVLAPGDDLDVRYPAEGTITVWLTGKQVHESISTSDVGTVSSATWTVPDDAADGSTVVVAFQSKSGTTFAAQALPVSVS